MCPTWKEPKLRKRKLRPVSKKRAEWLREYAKLKIAAEDLQECPVCKQTDFKEQMDCHHPQGRSTRDKTLNFIWVHRKCHDKIHSEGKWARKEGFLE